MASETIVVLVTSPGSIFSRGSCHNWHSLNYFHTIICGKTDCGRGKGGKGKKERKRGKEGRKKKKEGKKGERRKRRERRKRMSYSICVVIRKHSKLLLRSSNIAILFVNHSYNHCFICCLFNLFTSFALRHAAWVLSFYSFSKVSRIDLSSAYRHQNLFDRPKTWWIWPSGVLLLAVRSVAGDKQGRDASR